MSFEYNYFTNHIYKYNEKEISERLWQILFDQPIFYLNNNYLRDPSHRALDEVY
jgi:hypothetical protein